MIDPEFHEQLRQSEAWARAIFESSLDPLVMVDAEGRIQDFNPAAERTFGYSKSEAAGRIFADVIIPAHWRERYKQGLQRYAETGEGMMFGRRTQMPALRSDKTEIPVECFITVTQRPVAHPAPTMRRPCEVAARPKGSAGTAGRRAHRDTARAGAA